MRRSLLSVLAVFALMAALVPAASANGAKASGSGGWSRSATTLEVDPGTLAALGASG
jgi:hypothetical protein